MISYQNENDEEIVKEFIKEDVVKIQNLIVIGRGEKVLVIEIWIFGILFLPYIGEYFIILFSDFLFYRKLKMFLLKLKIRITKKLS